MITADCLPIVIASAGAVAAVHAGWRGLDAGVIANAVCGAEGARRGSADTPRSGPARASAVTRSARICTGASARCQDFRRGGNLDLKAIARVQLMEAGVARIHDAEICTICGDPELTFSYRREGPETGRQAAIAWLS